MKQPTIMYEGVRRAINSISWDSEGDVFGATFRDANGKFHTAHEKTNWNVEGYDEHGLLHMDFEKALKHNGKDENDD